MRQVHIFYNWHHVVSGFIKICTDLQHMTAKLFRNNNKNNFALKCCKSVQIKTKTISFSQLLQNMWIIKQTLVLLWKSLRKYGPVSYLFSCTITIKNANRKDDYGHFKIVLANFKGKSELDTHVIASNGGTAIYWNMFFFSCFRYVHLARNFLAYKMGSKGQENWSNGCEEEALQIFGKRRCFLEAIQR